jgi:rod shape-determining protein MreB
VDSVRGQKAEWRRGERAEGRGVDFPHPVSASSLIRIGDWWSRLAAAAIPLSSPDCKNDLQILHELTLLVTPMLAGRLPRAPCAERVRLLPSKECRLTPRREDDAKILFGEQMKLSQVLRSSHALAIDLGTANTCVYAPGRGIVLNEPSVVAFNTTRKCIEACGSEAKQMLGRTPGHLTAIKPLRDGVIADFEAAEHMLTDFIKRSTRRARWIRPRVVIGVPSEITQVERRAVHESTMRAKASEVYLVDEPVAAAIGAGLPITEPAGSMIVDIGGGTTDIAVLSLAGVVYSKSVRVAGNEMDEAIIDHMKKQHRLLIGERTAEQIKIEVGSAAPLDDELTIEVRGRHLTEGVPKSVLVADGEIREALNSTVDVLVHAVRNALEQIPPELSADIYDRGIVMTGGGALLRNLDKRLRDETKLPILMAEDPLSSVVMGAGRMLADLPLLKKLASA